jgi:hypothetical protein
MTAQAPPESRTHPRRQVSRFQYDVVAVAGKALGGRSYRETELQRVLDEHAADGWQLRFITEEPYRLLVTFERPTTGQISTPPLDTF